MLAECLTASRKAGGLAMSMLKMVCSHDILPPEQAAMNLAALSEAQGLQRMSNLMCPVFGPSEHVLQLEGQSLVVLTICRHSLRNIVLTGVVPLCPHSRSVCRFC